MTDEQRQERRDALREADHSAIKQLLPMVQSLMASQQTTSANLVDLSGRVARLEGHNRAQDAQIRSETANLETMHERFEARIEETQTHIDQWGHNHNQRLTLLEKRIGKPIDPKVLAALIGLVGPLVTAAAVVLAAHLGK